MEKRGELHKLKLHKNRSPTVSISERKRPCNCDPYRCHLDRGDIRKESYCLKVIRKEGSIYNSPIWQGPCRLPVGESQIVDLASVRLLTRLLRHTYPDLHALAHVLQQKMLAKTTNKIDIGNMSKKKWTQIFSFGTSDEFTGWLWSLLVSLWLRYNRGQGHSGFNL